MKTTARSQSFGGSFRVDARDSVTVATQPFSGADCTCRFRGVNVVASPLDTIFSIHSLNYPAADRLEACDRASFILSLFHRKKVHRSRDRCGPDRICYRASARQPADFPRTGVDQLLRGTSSRAGSIAVGYPRVSADQRAVAHFFSRSVLLSKIAALARSVTRKRKT